MNYEMSGTVTFMFSGVDTESADPSEAIHEVESMGLEELLLYSNDVVDVHVEQVTAV